MPKGKTIIALIICYALVGVTVTFWRESNYGRHQYGMAEDALFWPAVIFKHVMR
jgi:hypothetical protein